MTLTAGSRAASQPTDTSGGHLATMCGVAREVCLGLAWGVSPALDDKFGGQGGTREQPWTALKNCSPRHSGDSHAIGGF